MSKAAEKDSGQIYFGTSYYPDFRVIESGSGSPEAARIPVTASRSASSAHSDTSHGHGIDAGTITKLENLGNDGSMLAQEELGAIYFAGYGAIVRDYKKAVFWFQKAVDQNNSLMANVFLARMYENGWGVDQDSVLASGYYQSIKLSPGNPRLKKAIEPEWIEVEKEKKALSKFNNHVEYADAESRLHPTGHSVSDPGAAYMKVTISAEVIAALIRPQPDPKSQPCVNGPHLQEHRIFDSDSGQWLTPVTWDCE
jgi:Sel1 repeat-containing protein